VHDIEVTIANHRDNSFSDAKLKNDRAEFKKISKFSSRSTKETMTISKAVPV